MIKFRVWDKEHKRMLNIETLALSFSPKGVLTSIYTYGPDFSNDPEIIGDDEPDLDSAILEQFTGLKDVNGKDIYEGDILEVTIDGTVQADKYLVKNVWDPHVWTEESDGYYAVSKMEVKGNVHENPKLLEE